MTLRLAEDPFVTIQGEGPNSGRLTQFIRFATCNMKCPGWPCDTQYSWDPANRDAWEKIEVAALIDRLDPSVDHFCITGGEPLLQPKPDLMQLFKHFFKVDKTWDIFTNGSINLEPYWMLGVRQTIVMDWKCPSSGEGETKLKERYANLGLLHHWDAVKFVVSDEHDVAQAANIILYCRTNFTGQSPKFYFGPVWDTIPVDDIQHLIRDYIPHRFLSRVYIQVQAHKYMGVK